MMKYINIAYKKCIYVLMIMLLTYINAHSQVTTYFYGKDKCQSNKETAALYSVKIYSDYTTVTIELIPTVNRNRMNYYSSRNTYIYIDNDTKLYISGFLKNNNGSEYISTEPFSGNWGWDNVNKGEKYYYTMVFKGTIPPGVTIFSMIDDGDYNGSRGYGFRNYTINNPRKGGTSYTESSVKQNIDENNDGICGIYEGSDSNGYRLGCIKQNDEYYLIYLGEKKSKSYWLTGDIKASLRASSTLGFFKANYYMKDKTINTDVYVAFDGASMKIIIDGDDTFYLKMYPTATSVTNPSQNQEWSGSGFALNDGYVVTNYHVIEGAKSIQIQGVKGNFSIKYNAEVIATDKFNDIALLKVSDSRFTGFGTIPYNVKTTVSDVGEDIFVLGYPLTSTMGDEIKLTTGVISSKTGFQGDVSLYQISAPIQHGNSGGPLFDTKGNLVGIVSAKHTGAENVGYAIKTSYLRNLIESSISTNILPTSTQTATLPLTEKVKSLKNFVFMISCSNQATSNNSNINSYDNNSSSISKDGDKTIIKNPKVRENNDENCKIKTITLTKEYTAIEMICNNKNGYYESCNVNRYAYIKANGTYYKYKMTRTEGIEIYPDKTYFPYADAEITFTLYFLPIPKYVTSIDFIESDNGWKFYGIELK